jgi:WD40 repeat protein
MVMSLSLFHKGDYLTLAAGYENGIATVAYLDDSQESTSSWVVSYRSQVHSQPILSLDVSPDRNFFLTSSADDALVKHPIPPAPERNPSSAGTSSPAAKSDRMGSQGQPGPSRSLLSGMLAGSSPAQVPPPQPRRGNSSNIQVETQPQKVIHTKHSGQQDLKIRSDGKVFATAGWDSKVRVYSTKTMNEVAVLKWHPVGCYATAFADIDPPPAGGGQGQETAQTGETDSSTPKDGVEQAQGSEAAVAAGSKLVRTTLRDKRVEQALMTHWLAAGSKDGKVSLWDIF